MTGLGSQAEALEKAVQHVTTAWIPPQSEVLQRIVENLEKGAYEGNLERFVLDLKEDLSLYLFCLRELAVRAREAEEARPLQPGSSRGNEQWSPATLLRSADVTTLREIFAKAKSDISLHSIGDMSELQAQRFQESFLTATTAETLAGSNDLDPELGFSCGLMRQFGLTLIAWNYPRVYAKALESLNEGESLDGALQRALGFSPSTLGITLAQRWNLSDEVLFALGDKQKRRLLATSRTGQTPPPAKQVGEFLAKVCEVGEALARAHNPERYPTALADWETAQETIAAQLGPKGVKSIVERAQVYCREYARLSPQVAEFPPTEDLREKILESRHALQRIDKNAYLKNCPPGIRESICKFYHELKPNRILKKHLKTFLQDLVPAAGFQRGCVFILDPASQTLMPSAVIGNLPPERLRPIKLSKGLGEMDIVGSALSLKSPLKEDSVNDRAESVTQIAGSLGLATAVGVLYLERENASVTASTEAMQVFRALRQTLNDCLNLV